MMLIMMMLICITISIIYCDIKVLQISSGHLMTVIPFSISASFNLVVYCVKVCFTLILSIQNDRHATKLHH